MLRVYAAVSCSLRDLIRCESASSIAKAVLGEVDTRMDALENLLIQADMARKNDHYDLVKNPRRVIQDSQDTMFNFFGVIFKVSETKQVMEI